MNWVDYLLGVGFLSVVPFLLAAYGGHVAADTADDRKRRRIRIIFWSLCIVGIVITAAYQYRIAKSDIAKQTSTQQWQDGISQKLDKIIEHPVSPEQQQNAIQLKHELEHPPTKSKPSDASSPAPSLPPVPSSADKMTEVHRNLNLPTPTMPPPTSASSYYMVQETAFTIKNDSPWAIADFAALCRVKITANGQVYEPPDIWVARSMFVGANGGVESFKCFAAIKKMLGELVPITCADVRIHVDFVLADDPKTKGSKQFRFVGASGVWTPVSTNMGMIDTDHCWYQGVIGLEPDVK
jgi:hypothetical protein